MELLDRVRFLLGSIGIIIGIFSSCFLFLKTRNFSKANIFLVVYFFVFSIRMIKSLFYEHMSVSFTVHQLFLSSLLLIGPSVWFYHLVLCKNSIKKKDFFIHFSPFVFLVLLSFFVDLGYKAWFYLGIFLHGLFYCFYTLYHIFNKKTMFKNWLLLLVTLTILLFVNSILIFFKIVPFYPTSSLLYSCIIIVLFVYGLNNNQVFKEDKVKYANSCLSKEESKKYYQKLKRLMEQEKLYLDAELSLTKLSKEVGISSKELSQVINQIEDVNYSQFIVNYRVEEAKQKLKNPKYANYKISAIAFECGFNSISSFNNAFKKATNITAKEYKSSL